MVFANVYGQYRISGQLVDSMDQELRLVLEYVPTMDDLTSVAMKNIIQEVTLDKTGAFEFSGLSMPEERSLYRISINNHGVGIGISTGLSKNYILIAADPESQFHISMCSNISETFENCSISGDYETAEIQFVFDDIINPIHIEFASSRKRISDTRKKFINTNLVKDLKQFADTTKYMLAGLVAIGSISNLEEEYKVDPNFYHHFISKWENDETESAYLTYFKKKIRLFQMIHFESMPIEKKSNWCIYLLIALSLFLLAYMYKMHQKLTQFQKGASNDQVILNLDSLSKKELEVTNLILEGLSNKEIATNLFIETNTVKSHITKIFHKLNVKSRKELLKANKNRN